MRERTESNYLTFTALLLSLGLSACAAGPDVYLCAVPANRQIPISDLECLFPALVEQLAAACSLSTCRQVDDSSLAAYSPAPGDTVALTPWLRGCNSSFVVVVDSLGFHYARKERGGGERWNTTNPTQPALNLAPHREWYDVTVRVCASIYTVGTGRCLARIVESAVGKVKASAGDEALYQCQPETMTKLAKRVVGTLKRLW